LSEQSHRRHRHAIFEQLSRKITAAFSVEAGAEDASMTRIGPLRWGAGNGKDIFDGHDDAPHRYVKH
jgi:hypothetical protein